MLIIPAIDLLGKKVVRLSQGIEETAVVYSGNPLDIALHYQAVGAQWIHVVDLDGAFGRTGINDGLIQKLTETLTVPIELGGGIRTVDRIGYWLNRGVGRVVLGSAAVNKPDMVEKAIRIYGNKVIIVGIDIKDGDVAVHGWTEKSGMGYLDHAKKMKNAGLSRTIVTDISTDGMLSGPKIDAMIEIAENTGLHIIASGGVSHIDDLGIVSEHADRGIEGIIIGRAIYEKKLDIKQAIENYQA